MSNITAPMKGEAAPKDLTELRYPVLATPKLDGIRGMKVNGKFLSARFKSIPNVYTSKKCLDFLPDGADGELFVRGSKEMGEQTSAFMSMHGSPDFVYYMFDYDEDGNLTRAYRHRMNRMKILKEKVENSTNAECRDFYRDHVVFLLPVLCNNAEELKEFVDKCLNQGYEGAMIRDPEGPYKCGRSSVKQQYLLKIKPFEDGEGKIIGFEEQMENTNEAEKDAFGHTKRSSHKAGKVPKGTLGKFVVERLTDKLVFRVGTGKGLTNVLRQEIWDNQKKFMGKIIKYKHQQIGAKTAPRIAIFLGFRDIRDMTAY
jgi:DNA ligase-1